MSTSLQTRSPLIASLLTAAFLFSTSSFAAPPTPAAPMMPTTTTAVAHVNETCKKAHSNTSSQAYKDCVKKADAEKKH